MKLLLIPVWASLAAGTAHASVPLAFLEVPEPSTIVMLIVGLCAIGVGITGRGRRRGSE